MSMVGANYEQLEAGAARMRQAADELDAHARGIQGTIGGLSWFGQVATAFLNMWNGGHRRQLASTAVFIREAAKELESQARQQRYASETGAEGWVRDTIGRIFNHPPEQAPPPGSGATPSNPGGQHTAPVPGNAAPTQPSQPAPAGFTPGPQPISNSAIADAAEREINANPALYRGRTGWDQPGECMVAMSRWVKAAGGSWPGSPAGPLSGYQTPGTATSVPLGDLTRGDVIQRAVADQPGSWTGVHTAVVLKVNETDPTKVTIAESNYDLNGSMRIIEIDLDESKAGATWSGWRFGATA